jgi:hypothetical protein
VSKRLVPPTCLSYFDVGYVSTFVVNNTWIVKALKDGYTLRHCFSVLRDL